MNEQRMVGQWMVGPTIGKGGFSKVKIGMNAQGQKVALKIMKKSQFENLDDSTKKQVERELNAMDTIKHKNVIQFIEVAWDVQYPKSNGKTYPAIIVVLELATGGELFEFLSFTGCFEEAIARTYFQQLINGMGYCHENGIVHRDLKPENLLLSHDFVLKLADFGFSNSIPQDELMFTECGTPGYMAPEMIRNQGYVATKVDIWATGVILFIMIAGFPPIQQPTLRDWWFHKLASNKHALFWQAHCRNAYFSESLKDLINKILQPDPAKRIDVAGIMKHPWYTGETISDEALLQELTRRKATVDARKNAEANEKKMAQDAQMQSSGGMDTSVDRDLDMPPCPPSLQMMFAPQEISALSKRADSSIVSGMDGLDSMMSSMMTEYSDDEKVEPVVWTDGKDMVTYTSFDSNKEASDILARLSTAFETAQGEFSVKQDKYKVKARLLAPTGYVELTAQVYQDGNDNAKRVVQFRRLNGDAQSYRSLYGAIWNQVKDLQIEKA